MSEKQNRDFLKYNAMTTEELEEILRSDCDAPEDGESDTELLLYIMEVLTNRRNANNTGKTAQQAWESFQQQYLPAEEERFTYTQETKKPAKAVRPWLRRLMAAAAVIVLLICIPLTVSAFGWEDIWNAVATWAKETFSFISGENAQVSEPAVGDELRYTSLQQLLAEARGETELVPTWVPEGYALSDITIDEMPGRKAYAALYINGEKILIIRVQLYLNDDSEKVEINEELFEIYEVSGTEYYIFSNMDQVRANWIKDSYECYISGELTVEEIKTMIDSIGKG